MGLVKWELRAAGEGGDEVIERGGSRGGGPGLFRKFRAVSKLADWS